MADARELLAKLAPHGIQFDAISFGGIPDLTPQDIAAAIGMAHLDELDNALLRVRYCGDGSSWPTLRRCWYLATHDLGIAERWPRPSSTSPTWAVLSIASLLDHVGAHRCHACNGTCSIKIGPKVQTCPTCDGSGNREFSGRKLADIANVPSSTWARTYMPLLGVCRAQLATIDDRACAIVGAKLRPNGVPRESSTNSWASA